MNSMMYRWQIYWRKVWNPKDFSSHMSITLNSLSTKRNLQRKLNPNIYNPDFWANDWWACSKFSTFDWLSQEGFVGFEFTLQPTFGAKTVCSQSWISNKNNCCFWWNCLFVKWNLASPMQDGCADTVCAPNLMMCIPRQACQDCPQILSFLKVFSKVWCKRIEVFRSRSLPAI